LIGSDKVEVYRADDKQIGLIERVMIDKRSGKVSYAALAAFSASETIAKLISDEVKQWSRVFLAANMKRE
jgi:PRC-barrel domain